MTCQMSESYWSSRSSSAESDSNAVLWIPHSSASGCSAVAAGIADSAPESRGSPFGVRCHNFGHRSGLASQPRAIRRNG